MDSDAGAIQPKRNTDFSGRLLAVAPQGLSGLILRNQLVRQPQTAERHWS